MTNPRTNVGNLTDRFRQLPSEVCDALKTLAYNGYEAHVVLELYNAARTLVALEIAFEQNPVLQQADLLSTTPTLSTPGLDSSGVHPCPECRKALKNARDCKRHAQGHWCEYVCQINGCGFVVKRLDHFNDHVKHRHKAERCNVDPVISITDHWVARSCGVCQQLFPVEPTFTDTQHASMSKVFNTYLSHVFSHYKEGALQHDWTAINEVKGLLRQDVFAAMWEKICTSRVGHPAIGIRPEIEWREEVAQLYVKDLQKGVLLVNPCLRLNQLLDELLGSHTRTVAMSSFGADGSDLASMGTEWEQFLVDGFGDESFALFATNNDIAFTVGSTPNREQTNTAVTGTTAASSSGVDIGGTSATQEADTLQSDTVDSHPVWDKTGLTVKMGYLGNDMTNSMPYGGLESMPMLPQTESQQPLTQPPPLSAAMHKLETLSTGARHTFPITEAIHDRIAMMVYTVVRPPETLPYNPTPALPPVTRGHKRPRSGLEHLKRMSGDIFRWT